MGRRSFGISMTQINRIISASNAAARARQRRELIESQSGIRTERSPEYKIINFDFNEETRVSHIEFQEIKYYKKIERYVTRKWC